MARSEVWTGEWASRRRTGFRCLGHRWTRARARARLHPPRLWSRRPSAIISNYEPLPPHTPRYRAELSVGHACSVGPWWPRGVTACGLHEMDGRAPVEAMAGMSMPQEWAEISSG